MIQKFSQVLQINHQTSTFFRFAPKIVSDNQGVILNQFLKNRHFTEYRINSLIKQNVEAKHIGVS